LTYTLLLSLLQWRNWRECRGNYGKRQIGIKKTVIQLLSEQMTVELETIYTEQKPQFQQSANKPTKMLTKHPKDTEIWE
tara:strand:- start:870 stop:1106 length:237 start_codon:yes stop_codon:yes gene_type:complete